MRINISESVYTLHKKKNYINYVRKILHEFCIYDHKYVICLCVNLIKI